jgi:hypothetical protein
MNLRNAIPKLGVLALAAIAIAVPAPAVGEPGEVFTHEGVPIGGEGKVGIELSGPVSSSLAGSPSIGSDCAEVHVAADLEAEGTGTVTGYSSTGCTLTHPTLNGLEVDEDPINVKNWKLMIDKEKSLIFVTNVHIKQTTTFNKIVIAETTIVGDDVYEIPKGDTKKVKKVDVSGEEMTANGLPLNVIGELELTSETEIGIEE